LHAASAVAVVACIGPADTGKDNLHADVTSPASPRAAGDRRLKLLNANRVFFFRNYRM